MGNSTGWFYIGVYGYSHSLYTIRAQMNQGSQVPLLPGIS